MKLANELNEAVIMSKQLLLVAEAVSNEKGVSPSIVAGRLCHDKLLKWQQAERLRNKLKFA